MAYLWPNFGNGIADRQGVRGAGNSQGRSGDVVGRELRAVGGGVFWMRDEWRGSRADGRRRVGGFCEEGCPTGRGQGLDLLKKARGERGGCERGDAVRGGQSPRAANSAIPNYPRSCGPTR